MLNETEAAASFHGLCHFFGRLSKASRAGMKAALRGCPKCHFPMLEGLAHTISTHGQNGAVYVSDFAREAHQPLPAISRSLRQLEQDGLVLREADPADRRKTLVRITPEGYAACARCEDALSDYFACVMARLTPEQVQQMNTLRGALMDAILAENASREANGIPFRCKLLKLFLPKPPPAMTNILALPSGFSSSKSSPVSSKLPAVIPKSPETYWSVNTSSGVPYLSTYLPSIHKIWSDTRFAISSSWSDMITVRFFCLLSLWSIDKNSSLYFISRYEVGSSNTIISGC